MLVICITKDKKGKVVTASRSFKKGDTYDVRSHDAKKGLSVDEGGINDEPYFKLASAADTKKFYTEKQKNAAVRVVVKNTKAVAAAGNPAQQKQLEDGLAALHLKGEELDAKGIILDDKIKELDAAIEAAKTPKAE